MNLNIAQPCLRQRWQWSYLLRAVLLGQLVVWCVSCADDDHTGSEGAQDNNNNTWTWTGPGNGRTSNGSSATGATTTGETTGGTISERVPCISDGNCRVDEICRNDVCVDGCRADTDCASNGLCIQFTCVEEGVGCRIDAQCAPGSFCEPTTQRCQEDNGACRPDGFEPNDISSEASELPLGQTQGTICALDNDYFALPVEINTTIDLRLTFPEAGGDLQLQLLNSASAPLVRSENATGGEESIRFNVPEPGVYYARIFGADSSVETSYTLTYGG
ncbi:MAG: PPC domain-containing protein, partial [Myxococcota bacterium]